MERVICTSLYEGQGLGNQLWVYAAVRSIAEHLGAGFMLGGLECFKGYEFLEIDPVVNSTQNDMRRMLCGEISYYYEAQYYDSDLRCFSSGFDEAVVGLNGSYRLEGLFQSERYFFGDLDRLKRYIRIKKEWVGRVHVPEDTCILNIRGGEYKRHSNLILPMSYWAHAIRHMRERRGIERFVIVTDDVRYARAIFPQYEVLTGGVGECYVALNNARNLILSNSSFAYFPIKTSSKQAFVIAPKYWARFGNAFNRWASPANLYESWLWQDKSGDLYSYGDCLEGRDATEDHYRANYFIRSSCQAFNANARVAHFVPQSLRKKIKGLLSLVFPRRFG